MISGSKKNPPACRGVAAGKKNLVTLTTRERLAIAAGGSCGTNTPRKTPPSLAVLTLNMHLTGRVAVLVPPSSCSQNSTWRAVRACSQNAPVLPLKQHLLDPKDAPDGLGSLLDPKTHLLDHKMHLRAWSLRAGSLTGLGASGGNAPLHVGENFKTRGLQ